MLMYLTLVLVLDLGIMQYFPASFPKGIYTLNLFPAISTVGDTNAIASNVSCIALLLVMVANMRIYIW